MTDTASGAIATFDTSLALPLQDCTIEINAVQESGTPTPSSPKAISGFTGANIRVTGSNLWDEDWEVQGTFIWSKNYIPVKPNTSYYRKSPYNLFPRFYDNSFTEIGTGIWGKDNTFTTPSNASYLKFMVDPAYGTTYNNDISINYPATDTAYHAYDGNTTAITWQSEVGTVYGGSLDVTSGVLTVDSEKITLNGSENYWSGIATSGGVVRAYTVQNFDGIEIKNCDCLKIENAPTEQNNIWTTDKRLCLNPSWAQSVTNINEFKTLLASNNVVIVKSITPVTYQLTPTQISAIVGTNNVFTDTNGDTTLEYYTNKTVKDAINEVNDKADTNTTSIGDLSQLTTSDKSSLVGAVNEVNDVTDISSNVSKTSIVNDFEKSVIRNNKLVSFYVGFSVNSTPSSVGGIATGFPIPKTLKQIPLICVSGTNKGKCARCAIDLNGNLINYYSDTSIWNVGDVYIVNACYLTA
jgi:hypothetical protein